MPYLVSQLYISPFVSISLFLIDFDMGNRNEARFYF